MKLKKRKGRELRGGKGFEELEKEETVTAETKLSGRKRKTRRMGREEVALKIGKTRTDESAERYNGGHGIYEQ